MSTTQSQINSFALQDILLGIVDGLTEAQERLRSLPPYDEYGRPNPNYQVPYLDFNLQVVSEFQTIEQQNTPGSKTMMKFKPAPKTQNAPNSVEIFSTITGRFVAVVPNDGLPQTVINATVTALPFDPNVGTSEFDLEIELINAIGEKLSNTWVEFNYDENMSVSLNNGGTLVAPIFEFGELKTDVNGIVTNRIQLDPTQYNAGKFLVISVNTGTVYKSVSISNS